MSRFFLLTMTQRKVMKPITKKTLIGAAIAAMTAFVAFFVSCSGYRSVNMSIDKAEKVDVQVRDYHGA